MKKITKRLLIWLIASVTIFSIATFASASNSENTLNYVCAASAVHDVTLSDIDTEILNQYKNIAIQKVLYLYGYYINDIDGIFGEYTKAAIVDFQTANGLTVDGIAEEETLGVLYSLKVISFEDSGLTEHYESLKQNKETDSSSTIASELSTTQTYSSENYDYYTASEFMYLGTVNFNGWRWTYYSQRVLPGGGLSIPGRYVDSDGFVCDENGYICLASPISGDKGSVYLTPFGRYGKVYDYCGTAGTLDIYVDW